MWLRHLCRIIVTLISCGMFLFGIYHLYFYYQEKPEGNGLPLFPMVTEQTRLLVIAPHCDDETLGCGGIMQAVLAAGGKVMVVFMTNGDGFTFAAREQFHRLFLTSADYIQSGYNRQTETVNALKHLGISEQQIVFLGYPDRGLKDLWTDYWEDSQPFHSHYTQNDHTPYTTSYQKNAPYAGEAVLANLEQIMHDFKPTLILSPHPADEHPDHASTWAFATTSLIEMSSNRLSPEPQLYTYLIHRGDFPIPHGYKPEASLLPPKPLYQVHNNRWKLYSLNVEHEVVKEQALKEYVSQLRVPIMSGLLHSFIRRNELFEEIDIPIVKQNTTEPDLFNLDAWSDREAFLINPLGVTVLGALEKRAKLAAITCVVQNNVVWLYFHIPEFEGKRNQYEVSLIEFRKQQGLQRETRVFSFSVSDTSISADNLRKFKDGVIVKIPYCERGLPDFFFIRVLAKDSFGVENNHTVWQPVLVNSTK